MSTAPGATRRVRARVEGTVQGVGFRPYVFRLAGELGLGGYVLNDARGVLLEVEGPPDAVDALLARLAAEAPPLAAVERVLGENVAPTGERGFRIATSAGGADPSALVSADTATCDDCLAELRDRGDRRFRYPFINCTNCGPRFTIVRGVPYDRSLTTMASFAMCARCQAEYDDPRDRRFHAQPNACPACGPTVRLLDSGGAAVTPAEGADPVRTAAAALRDGAIVAVKGLGGFHLACRADDEAVVGTLRARKHREDKPFALMVADLERARALVELGGPEEELLLSRPRPIVLATARAGAPIAGSVAPDSRELGIMLPYSPLHHLLCGDFAAIAAPGGPAALVLTSGNASDEPIAYRDEDALERLGAIADRFLIHDREIHMRTDDSVVRAVAVAARRRRPLTLRRSRGYVPASLPLPTPAGAPPLLACGADLKSAFCVAKDGRAWVGHHVGDLESWETLRSFREGIEHFERLFAVAPELVAHDLHPGYHSTGYALERADVRHVGVQHHHAHLVACLAEHAHAGPAVGAIYDGTGYGTDGTAWGGELLAGDATGFERAGHLRPVCLPGGERAIREPWRMACAWLREALDAEPPLPPTLAAHVMPERWSQIAELARSGFASPATTSAGRLFDAVAALCGLHPQITYEGQAAIALEAACDPHERGAYAIALAGVDPHDTEDTLELDPREAVREIARDAAAGVTTGVIAARFHRGLAEATARALARVAAPRGLEAVVLSGGVFANRRLLEETAQRLDATGLRVLVPERLPPGDGGISYGQAAIATARTGVSGA